MEFLGMLQDAGLPDSYANSHRALRELLHITKSLGGHAPDNVDACITKCKAIVSEIYSPPRVTRAAELLPQLNIDPG